MARKHNFNLSKAELDMIIRREKFRASQYTLQWSMVFMAQWLHEKHGFGTKRIMEMKEGFYKYSDMINEGIIDGQDMKKWCEDMGLDFFEKEKMEV